MRAVIGVDESLSSRQALDLFLKLRFQNCEAVLVYAVESVLPDGSFVEFPEGHPLGDLMRETVANGCHLLRQARARVMAQGIEVKTELLQGPPAKVLQDVATRENADLIVIGSNRRSALDDLLLGSTARTLLHESPQHLLIGRRPVLRSGKLNAVFAIDQRAATDPFVQGMLALAPSAIGKIDLLTVNPFGSEDFERLDHLPANADDMEDWIAQGLRKENAALAERLAPLGADCQPVVVEGEMPACAISMAADRAQADLIVVGAERHGFLDRHLRRSVSEGLLATDKRALLVLRHGKVNS